MVDLTKLKDRVADESVIKKGVNEFEFELLQQKKNNF